MLIAICSLNTGPASAESSIETANAVLAAYGQEIQIVRKLRSISEANPAQSYSIRHVNIIDVDSGKTVENMRVTIESGRIASIHQDDTAENNNNDNVVIDAEGKFLLPGLADMHVHQLFSADVHILNLANGVTTVRDLDGFAWMLEWRKQARQDQWVFPDMIVSRTIIAAYPMGIYAAVVDSEVSAR